LFWCRCILSPLSTFRWTFSTSEELDGSKHPGILATYNGGGFVRNNGGGFVRNLGKKKSESLAIIEDLKSKLWIDRATRAVFVDFTVYNANINLFCVVR